MTFSAKIFLRLVALAVAAGVASGAHAEPTVRPLRVVVPFSAGGTADVLARLVAEKLRPRYPAGVLVENTPGANGGIGADMVYRAEPDGFTLLSTPPGPVAINQSLYKKLAYDPARFTPITVIATAPNILAVSNKLPVHNVGELIAYLKANPGKASFASQGNGSTSHLTATLFMSLTGTTMVHVPYKGTAPALVDLMAGQVDLFFDNISSSLPMNRGGKIRILAVADDHRSPVLPGVPTFAEAGLPAMQAVTWFAMVAPPGTPPAAVASLQAAIAEVLAQDDVRKRFAEYGAQPGGWASDRTQRFIRDEAARWGEIIKKSNVTLD